MYSRRLIICAASFFGLAGHEIGAQAGPIGAGLKFEAAAPGLVETAAYRRCVPYGYYEGLSYCYWYEPYWYAPRYHDSYHDYSYRYSYRPRYRESGFPENYRTGSKRWWEEMDRLNRGGGQGG